jgi:hypothetical protein
MTIEEEISKVKESDAVFLHMAHWSGTRIKVVTPKIGKKLADKLSDIVIKNLESKKGCSEEPYNVVGSKDDTIETAKKSSYEEKISNILEAIKNPTVKFKFQQNNFDFFIYEFPLTEEQSILAFRRTKKMQFLKKGFIGQLSEGHFKDIDEENLIGVDDCIDFILDDDDIIIFQHISFERVLKLKNEFTRIARKVLNKSEFEEKIVGFDELKDVALNNGNYVKRLSKLGGTNRPTLFLEDLEKTKQVSDEFNLGITVDVSSEKIFFNDVTQVGDFINFMQDAYYQTLIGNELGRDEMR